MHKSNKQKAYFGRLSSQTPLLRRRLPTTFFTFSLFFHSFFFNFGMLCFVIINVCVCVCVCVCVYSANGFLHFFFLLSFFPFFLVIYYNIFFSFFQQCFLPTSSFFLFLFFQIATDSRFLDFFCPNITFYLLFQNYSFCLISLYS